MKPRPLAELRKSSRMKAAIAKAKERFDDTRVGAVNTMDLALLVADQVMTAEVERTHDAIALAIRLLEGDDGLDRAHVVRRLRAAIKRQS